LAVANIDNSFGAGCAVALIVKQIMKNEE